MLEYVDWLLRRRQMDAKIIFFDIDGTILSERTGNISKSTIDAIKKAQSNGHLAFINTGRTYAEIDSELIDIGFDGYVCGCGTYITYHNIVLLNKTISDPLCKAILQDLITLKIDAVLEGSSAVYYADFPALPKLVKLRSIHKDIKHFNIQSWSSRQLQFDKFCIWPSSPISEEQFCLKYNNQFDFINRGGFYEVVPKGCSKASGIAFLLEYLNLPHENTYALGDGANDLAMLKYVKHSIAMGNSKDEIKNIVTFVTSGVDDDGAAYALKHFGII
jgi:Cof subfamily protein (haloacid dehalogenase superfamily)